MGSFDNITSIICTEGGKYINYGLVRFVQPTVYQ